MSRSPVKIIFSLLVLSALSSEIFFAQAKTEASDPNAAVKKLQSAAKVPGAPAGVPQTPPGPPQIPGAKALADLQAAQKRNNELGVISFTQAIKENPKDSSAYTKRGKAYSGLQVYDKAAADYDKAIELDPKALEAYQGRAVLKYMKKDFAGSREDVKQVKALGGKMWPAFTEALKASSEKKS